jgi:tetratricopeptide (TPR) repeat protein
MKSCPSALLSLLILLVAAGELQAQGGGGRGRGGHGGPPGGNRDWGDWRDWRDRQWNREGPLWQKDLDESSRYLTEENSDRVLVFYAYAGEAELDIFRIDKVRDYAEENVVMVRNEFDKNSPAQQGLSIRQAPTFVGMDRYQNEWSRLTTQPNGEQFIAWIKDLKERIRKFQEELKADANKAREWADKGDEARALKEFGSIANCGKKGWPEIGDARAWILDRAETHFKKARLLLEKAATEAEGIKLLEEVSTTFKGLSPSMLAQLHLAEFLSSKGEIKAALEKIHKVLKSDVKLFKDEIVKAQSLLGKLIEQGIGAIRAALLKGADGDVDAAKTLIAKIGKDYSGTEVAKHASEVLNELGK